MKWYIGYPLLFVLGCAFWMFADAMKRVPGGVSFMALEPGAFLGLCAWMCALWAGMVLFAVAIR